MRASTLATVVQGELGYRIDVHLLNFCARSQCR
jgi:hypothetical protein